MSQDTFPFAEGEEAVPYLEEAENNRRTVLVAGGLVAALVLGAGGWFLLGGTSTESVDSAFVPNSQRPAAVAPKAPVQAAKKLPAPYKERLGRDPFKALYVAPVAAPAVVPAAAAAPVVAPPATSGGTTTPTGTGTTGTTGTSTGSTRYALTLVSISKPSPEVRFSTWKVGTTSATVIPAQRFGKYGEIVVLAFSKNAKGEVDKAIIQVGDDSPMDVAIGQTVNVL